VTVEGTLTTGLGSLESSHVGFVEDATAGIAVYLDAAAPVPWPAGTTVRISGRIDERYGARTLRTAVSDILAIGSGPLPVPLDRATGSIGESVEGRLVTVDGVTIGSPTAFADGTGLLVDDGSGSVRVIVSAEALAGATVPAGTPVVATGPVGQRDSTGTGSSGYRINVTEAGSLMVLPTPSPSPTGSPDPSPTPSPAPTSAPSASPTPAATPTAAPTPAPVALDVVSARSRPVGSRIRVMGVVIAEAGRLGLPPVFAIGDGTAGLAVRLADGMRPPARGTTVTLDGVLAAPYGQLELRLVAGGLAVAGPGTLPDPLQILAADLGEPTEGRLVTIEATLTGHATRATSGDLSADFIDAAGARFRVLADASSGLTSASFVSGHAYGLVGIVGQHASRKGALDGYRVWLRDTADMRPGSPSGGLMPGAAAISIAEAIRRDGAIVTIEASVSAGPGLLDSTGRRIVVSDASGAVEVDLPGGITVRIGDRIRATGEVGRAWGAPRVVASSVDVLEAGAPPRPETLAAAPGPAHEWRLVRIAGQVVDVRRLGATWRAEVLVGRTRVVVDGLAGANIASTAIVEGRPVTIVGIVRRPYPTATDRRYQVVPRGPSDVALGPPSGAAAGAAVARPTRGDAAPAGSGAGPTPIDIDLATLADHVGELVRVGGLVVAPTADGFSLDDATAVVGVVLRGEAGAYLELLEPGDALNATGRVERAGGELIVAVDAASGLVRVGDLGEALPLGAPVSSATALPSPIGSASGPALADAGGGLPGNLPVGVSGLVAISILSVALTLARRRAALARATFTARARLAELERDQRSA
jgi:hypothetical protein